MFVNFGYEQDQWATTFNLRTDENNLIGTNDSYKFGVIRKDIFPRLDVKFNHAKGFKNPSLYEMFGADNYGYKGNLDLTAENSTLNELSFDYNDVTLSLFQTDTGDLNTDGIELSYNIDNFTIYGSHLNSKKNDTVQLRRPKWILGVNHNTLLPDNFQLTTNYKFVGEHLDIHNSNWSTIFSPLFSKISTSAPWAFFNGSGSS